MENGPFTPFKIYLFKVVIWIVIFNRHVSGSRGIQVPGRYSGPLQGASRWLAMPRTSLQKMVKMAMTGLTSHIFLFAVYIYIYYKIIYIYILYYFTTMYVRGNKNKHQSSAQLGFVMLCPSVWWSFLVHKPQSGAWHNGALPCHILLSTYPLVMTHIAIENGDL